MSDNRKVAKDLIIEAAETILKNRPGLHGSAEQSFEMIADLWTVYVRHCRRTRGNDTIRGEDVAEMMTLLKKARKIYGQSSNRDNDVDDIGYTALAGMLRLPDPYLEDKEQGELDKVDVLKEEHAHQWDEEGEDAMCVKCGMRKTSIVMVHSDIRSGDSKPDAAIVAQVDTDLSGDQAKVSLLKKAMRGGRGR